MPKPTSRKRAAASNEYDSDGGFVEDAPRSKKTKASASSGNTGVQKDEEGSDFWELSRTRRVQIPEFKGNTMVNIREFYEKDDRMLPGKKGISLTLDQFKVMIEALPEIEASLKSKGLAIPRPQYDGVAGEAELEATHEEADDAEDAKPAISDADYDEEIPKPSKGKLDRFKMGKGNHEATSDEDN